MDYQRRSVARTLCVRSTTWPIGWTAMTPPWTKKGVLIANELSAVAAAADFETVGLHSHLFGLPENAMEELEANNMHMAGKDVVIFNEDVRRHSICLRVGEPPKAGAPYHNQFKPCVGALRAGHGRAWEGMQGRWRDTLKMPLPHPDLQLWLEPNWRFSPRPFNDWPEHLPLYLAAEHLLRPAEFGMHTVLGDLINAVSACQNSGDLVVHRIQIGADGCVDMDYCT